MTKTDLVAVTDLSPEAAGAITLWRLAGDTNYETLRQGLIEAGLEEKFLPELPSAETALRRAVQDQTDKRVLVRALPGAKGWALVLEQPRQSGATASDDTNALDYGIIMTAKLVVDPNDSHYDLVFGFTGRDATEAKRAAEIRAAFEMGMLRLTSRDTASWLCEMVHHVKAIALRDTGGVYFVPRTTLDTWRAIVKALKRASGTFVAEIPALRSVDAVEALVDSLNREAQAAMEAMEAELMAGIKDNAKVLGERAIDTRAARCEAMAEKLGTYEALLGVNLDKLRARLDGVKGNLAAAMLIAQERSEAV